MNQPEKKRLFSIVIIGVSSIQAVIMITRYMQARVNLSNPLIPQSLVDKVANFSGIMFGFYIAIVILNAVYLWKKKMFWPVATASVVITVGLALFGHQLHEYYFNS